MEDEEYITVLEPEYFRYEYYEEDYTRDSFLKVDGKEIF